MPEKQPQPFEKPNRVPDSNLPKPLDIGWQNGQAPFSEDHEFRGVYDGYGINTEYSYDSGWRAMPIIGSADDARQVAQIRVHKGVSLKIVTFRGRRQNNKPSIPSTDTGDPNDMLVSATVKFSCPSQMIDSKVYEMSGTYVYQLLKAKVPGSSARFYTGATPAETLRPIQQFYDAGDFLQGDRNPIDCKEDEFSDDREEYESIVTNPPKAAEGFTFGQTSPFIDYLVGATSAIGGVIDAAAGAVAGVVSGLPGVTAQPPPPDASDPLPGAQQGNVDTVGA